MKREELVVTNIRLPKEDLLEYRWMALAEGKSFPAWLRGVMRQFAKAMRKPEAQHT